MYSDIVHGFYLPAPISSRPSLVSPMLSSVLPKRACKPDAGRQAACIYIRILMSRNVSHISTSNNLIIQLMTWPIPPGLPRHVEICEALFLLPFFFFFFNRSARDEGELILAHAIRVRVYFDRERRERRIADPAHPRFIPSAVIFRASISFAGCWPAKGTNRRSVHAARFAEYAFRFRSPRD